jgi:hypothetical protein
MVEIVGGCCDELQTRCGLWGICMSDSSVPRQDEVGASADGEDMPLWVLFVALTWLVVLSALFFIWITTPGLRDDLPKLYGHDPGIPVEAPWFGAIGGLAASLGGIFYYNRGTWRASYNYWHAVKPAMGAITGGVACVLLVVILRGASGNGKISTDATTFDASAFVFGYAESAFRELIASVTNVFLKPGKGTDTDTDAKPPVAPKDDEPGEGGGAAHLESDGTAPGSHTITGA